MPFPNGARIRERREELDLSTGELADRLGISQGFLRNIEGGHDPASNRVLHRIARHLAVSVDELMRTSGGEGIPDPPPPQPKNLPTHPPKRQDSEGGKTGPRRAVSVGGVA